MAERTGPEHSGTERRNPEHPGPGCRSPERPSTERSGVGLVECTILAALDSLGARPGPFFPGARH